MGQVYKSFGPKHNGVFPVQDDTTIIGSGVAVRLLPNGDFQVSVNGRMAQEDFVGNCVATVGAAQVARLRSLLEAVPTSDAETRALIVDANHWKDRAEDAEEKLKDAQEVLDDIYLLGGEG